MNAGSDARLGPQSRGRKCPTPRRTWPLGLGGWAPPALRPSGPATSGEAGAGRRRGRWGQTLGSPEKARSSRSGASCQSGDTSSKPLHPTRPTTAKRYALSPLASQAVAPVGTSSYLHWRHLSACACVCDARGNPTSSLSCPGILRYESLAFAARASSWTHLLLRNLKPDRERFLPAVRGRGKPAISMGAAGLHGARSLLKGAGLAAAARQRWEGRGCFQHLGGLDPRPCSQPVASPRVHPKGCSSPGNPWVGPTDRASRCRALQGPWALRRTNQACETRTNYP